LQVSSFKIHRKSEKFPSVNRLNFLEYKLSECKSNMRLLSVAAEKSCNNFCRFILIYKVGLNLIRIKLLSSGTR